MGQIIGTDIIATPSHSAGTITLPPSLLTLGGRQYRTSTLTRLIATDVTLLANTLYFVYAQIVTGVPVLRISASAPSGYEISNPTANLIAGFYTNGTGSPTLGSFVNPDGVPVTANGIIYQATISGLAMSFNEFVWDRVGQYISATGRITPSGSGSAVTAILSLPGSLVPVLIARQIVGTFTRNNAGGAAVSKGGFTFVDGSNVGITFSPADIFSSVSINWDQSVLASALWSINDVTGINFRCRVSGWSNTALKDL